MGKTKPIPEGHSNLLVYLSVKNAAKAIEYYEKAFGAREVGRLTMPGNVIAHAELQVGTGRIMLADEQPQWGNKAPEAGDSSPVGICLYVEDVDRVFRRALELGGTIDRDMDVKDQFYGDRSGTLVDPFGHRWTIASRVEDMSFEQMQKRMEEMFSQQAKN